MFASLKIDAAITFIRFINENFIFTANKFACDILMHNEFHSFHSKNNLIKKLIMTMSTLRVLMQHFNLINVHKIRWKYQEKLLFPPFVDEIKRNKIEKDFMDFN